MKSFSVTIQNLMKATEQLIGSSGAVYYAANFDSQFWNPYHKRHHSNDSYWAELFFFHINAVAGGSNFYR